MPQLLAALTGGPAATAAAAQRDLYGNVLGMGLPQIGVGQQEALGYLGQGRTGALDRIAGGVTQGRGDITAGGANALDYISGGGRGALDYLGQGTQAGRDALATAGTAYAPLDALAGRYGGATSLALDALGTGGQGGYDRALSAFRAGPAYNFNLDQGLEAINRSRNARGMLNSGNTDRDAQNYGAGLASREFDSWMSRLLGFAPLELSATGTAATGRAGLGRDLANLEATTAGRGADILGRTGLAMGDVAGRTGTSLADLALRGGLAGSGVEQAYGQGAAGQINTATGQRLGLLGNAADAYGRTYGDQATAEMQASGNLINLGQNLLRTAVGAGGIPGLGGGGGMNLNALGSSLPSFLRNGPAGGFSFA